MQQFLYEYDLNPTTWVYLSSLLIIAIYFKFSRFWSIRNLDLVGLLALAPGLLMLAYRADVKEVPPKADIDQQGETAQTEQGEIAALNSAAPEPVAAEPQLAITGPPTAEVHRWGFILLFGVGFLFLIRMLFDTAMVRRPLLEPNLSPGGLAFLGIALFVFLMTNVFSARVPGGNDAPSPAGKLAAITNQAQNDVSPAPVETDPANPLENMEADELHVAATSNHPILRHLPSIPSRAFDDRTVMLQGDWPITARFLVFSAHLTIILCLLAVGLRHFGNLGTGVAMGALYLLLPYTAQLVGRVDHVMPPALLMLAIVFYRRPAIAGFLLTATLGVMLCPLPLFLFPLWISFYWQRGLGRFLAGVGCGFAVLVAAVLALEGFAGLPSGLMALLGNGVFGLENAGGFWTAAQWYWRIPVGALFLVISLAMGIWPAQKNLGTLMSCSAAVMLSAQFWYPFNGMMYVHWFLPLALLAVFRPNLENRIAIASLGRPWWTRKREVTPQAA